jgi:hypothetical protein
VHSCVSVAHSLDRHERAVSRSSEHFHESAFLISFNYLMDRDFAFFDGNIKLVLNLVSHIDDSLSGYTVEDGAIIGRSDQLVVAVSALPESENVHDSHLCNVVV